MKLQADEMLIVGNWTLKEGKMLEDYSCERIHWLIQHNLVKVYSTDGGWATVYQDPEDGRYWQLNYPKGELQGGGQPMLKCLGTTLS
jgi:hypothetical protein